MNIDCLELLQERVFTRLSTKYLLAPMVGLSLAATCAAETLLPLKNVVPAAVELSQNLGQVPSSMPIHVSVILKAGNPAALDQYADSVSDPRSINYRNFLSSEKAGEMFGPPLATQQAVADYLTKNGFHIDRMAKSRMAILATGTAAGAEAAFHTTICQFHQNTTRKGEPSDFYSFTSSVQVPAAIAPTILGVSGLESHTRPIPLLKHASKFDTPSPLTPAQTTLLNDLGPLQTGTNYGSGVTVAVSSYVGFATSNFPLFVNYFQLPAPAAGAGSNVTIQQYNGGSENSGENGEGDLDPEMVLGQAPLANVIIYDGNGDPLDVLTAEEDDNKADVVTESYGWNLDTDYAASCHQEHQLMTTKGITYSVASGDSGTGDDTSQYNYPDYEPEVLLVGGTVTTLNSDGTRDYDVGWNGSGGGWISTEPVSYNVLPSWQKGTGVPTSINFRLFPDVAFVAAGTNGATNSYNQTAYQYVQGGDLYGADGTSFASPIFAGSLANVIADLKARGQLAPDSNGKYRLGRVNDLIYSQNGRSDVYYDVTSGSNGNLPNGSTANCTTGWDFVTGWGCIDFTKFDYSVTNYTLTLASSTVSGSAGTTGTVTIPNKTSVAVSIALSSQNSTYVGVPSSVTIPAGASSATFSVTTAATGTATSYNINAAYDGVDKSVSLTVDPSGTGAISSLTLNPASVNGGTSSTGTVTLVTAAPAGGYPVTLKSSNSTYVTVPASVTVAAGATKATFTATTKAYSSNYSVTLTGSNGTSKASGVLTVLNDSVSSVRVNPSTIAGGSPATGTVTLKSAAPTGGWLVKLTSSNPYVTVPASVTVAAGATTATFTLTTKAYTSTYTVNITAKDNTTTASTSITITGDSIASLSVNPTSVVGGNTSTATVTLNHAAPAGGYTVQLSSSNANFVGVPTTVTVAAGATTATFTVTTKAYPNTYTATVGASDALTRKTATLTVTP